MYSLAFILALAPAVAVAQSPLYGQCKSNLLTFEELVP